MDITHLNEGIIDYIEGYDESIGSIDIKKAAEHMAECAECAYEAAELSNIICKLEKDSRLISVPESFSVNAKNLIQAHENNIKRRRHTFSVRKLAVIAASFIIISCTLLLTIPSLRAYAYNIPLLGPALNYFIPKGVLDAKNHGYSQVQLVSINKDGYTLNIDTVTIDEEQLFIAGEVIGEGPKESIEPGFGARITVNNLKIIRSSSSNTMKDLLNPIPIYFSYTADLKKEYFENFINNNPKFISINVLVNESPNPAPGLKYKTWVEFKNVEIPFDVNSILKSKIITVNKSIMVKGLFDYGITDLAINKLIISPTTTKFEFDYKKNEKPYIEVCGIINPRLTDINGNEYYRTIVKNDWRGITPLELPVSIYYKNDIEKLVLYYDGMVVRGYETGFDEVEIFEKGEVTIDIN